MDRYPGRFGFNSHKHPLGSLVDRDKCEPGISLRKSYIPCRTSQGPSGKKAGGAENVCGVPRLVNYRGGMLFQCAPVKKKKTISALPTLRLVKPLGDFRESNPCWNKDQGHKLKEGLMRNSASKGSCKRPSDGNPWRLIFGGCRSFRLGLGVLLLCAFPAVAQSQQSPGDQGAAAQQQSPNPQLAGTISGTAADPTRAGVAGATVKLSREGPFLSQDVTSDGHGQFSFASLAPGPFQLTITAAGFAMQTSSGTLH